VPSCDRPELCHGKEAKEKELRVLTILTGRLKSILSTIVKFLYETDEYCWYTGLENRSYEKQKEETFYA
jgi:hypothetical protein